MASHPFEYAGTRAAAVRSIDRNDRAKELVNQEFCIFTRGRLPRARQPV